ncbi:MAG: ATP-binding protein [Phenylobacterium sp.]|nr:ATP-binding protein [Phenylobacterium sp.]
MIDQFVPLSVTRRLIARMEATHQRRRISVFSGPPGIGKTTAIDRFRAENPGSVAVVKVARRPAKEVVVLQHALESVRRLKGSSALTIPSSIWVLRSYLFRAFCEWGGIDAAEMRKSEEPIHHEGRFTLVFDEAQNLARDAIEVLRFWNDADRCYAPFPIGIIFVGNSEFALAGSARESVISAAVADRALYLQTLDYDDVNDDDLRLMLDAHGGLDEGAVAALVRAFGGSRPIRSLRRLLDILEELEAFSAGGRISAPLVRQVLQAA